MGARQSSPSTRLITLGTGSASLTDVSHSTWKNTSADNSVLQATAFASS
jgi:hypothetical protein